MEYIIYVSPESFWPPAEENILIQVSDLLSVVLRVLLRVVTWVELLTNKDTGAMKVTSN